MDHIYETWEKQAGDHGDSHAASWGDIYAIELEVEFLNSVVANGEKVLDVGCANGFSSFKLLEEKEVELTGLDFSPTMIEAAHARQSRDSLPGKFVVGDVRKLPFEDNSFDTVYTTRVLINLPTWEEQIVGMEECFRVCKPGGKVVFLEAFWEPLCRLNALRAIGGLDPLVEHDFNRYLKEARLAEYLDTAGKSFRFDSHMSLYYVGTRFLRELLSDDIDIMDFANPFNESFRSLEQQFSGGDFGVQKAVVIEL